jgi:hypothetical protein
MGEIIQKLINLMCLLLSVLEDVKYLSELEVLEIKKILKIENEKQSV